MSIIVQAASCGIVHMHGFPRRLSGMFLASIYGLMLGFIRLRAGEMLAPWLTHVFADVTIFAIIAPLVGQSDL